MRRHRQFGSTRLATAPEAPTPLFRSAFDRRAQNVQLRRRDAALQSLLESPAAVSVICLVSCALLCKRSSARCHPEWLLAASAAFCRNPTALAASAFVCSACTSWSSPANVQTDSANSATGPAFSVRTSACSSSVLSSPEPSASSSPQSYRRPLGRPHRHRRRPRRPRRSRESPPMPARVCAITIPFTPASAPTPGPTSRSMAVAAPMHSNLLHSRRQSQTGSTSGDRGVLAKVFADLTRLMAGTTAGAQLGSPCPQCPRYAMCIIFVKNGTLGVHLIT